MKNSKKSLTGIIILSKSYMEQTPEKIDVEALTAVNPDGFFADLTDSDACSVSVAVRVRPLVGRELTEGNRKECIQKPEGRIAREKLQLGAKSFNFDRVFWADDSQEYIFDSCTRNLVLGCFHGFNATILAYGQTGSGKTHTMGTGSTIGVPFEKVGIVPRVFKFIFDELDNRKAQSEYSEFKVKVSFLELYNEEFHDLLDPASMQRDRITGKPQKEITIREEKSGIISVRGLKEEEVTSMEQCSHLLNSGINHRQTSSTLMNEGSSRSHAIFTVTIEQKIVKEVEGEIQVEKKGEEVAQTTEEISSKFHFVDLAGSERIKKTGATGMLLKEGISINKGLLCLGQVISALTDEKKAREHIPYRDSKLTRILQDSLGGNSRTTMIACVSPAESNLEESLSTVKYASRARNIKNKPVVNRDPNSQLIESLRGQIKQLQFEVAEYVIIVKQCGGAIPSNLEDKIAERTKKVEKKALPAPTQSGSSDPGEVRELKIKLSHRDREIRELQQRLKDQQLFLDKKEKQVSELEKERDNLALKSESMSEKLKSNNIEFDSKQFEQKKGEAPSQEMAQKTGLIDAYKAKLSKAQKDLDSKIREMQQKDQEIAELKKVQATNDKMLRKHMSENQTLKKQIASGGGGVASGPTGSPNKKADALPAKRDFKSMRAQRKETSQQSIEEFNQKFLNDLQGQIDDMFTKSIKLNKQEEAPDGEQQIPEGESTPVNNEDAEKEKLLDGVRKMALSMQTDIKDLLKNEWAGNINNLEGEKKKAENDHKQNLLKAKNDQKATLAIEKEHKAKMDGLNAQVVKLQKEKEKKEESVAKQIALQEARIKALEADVEKQKKIREEVEKAKKFDENRFFKFKMTASKDIQQVKQQQKEKEKQMSKLKNEMKKVESIAQQKISQLKGLQKRAQEEKIKKEQLEAQENESKGIDIDLIKAWITSNTDAMLKHQELKEYLTKQQDQKDKLENEMLEEGDKMTDLLIMKEKLEYEKEEIENSPNKDEGRLLEIDDEMKGIGLEINSITETLDMLEEALEFVQEKVYQVTEEIEGFDIESVQPLSFNALKNIDSAKATLKTFFSVVLDLNVYKRDLEQKCIEQDETVIQLQANLTSAEARIQYMITHGGNDGYATHVAKQNAVASVIAQVDGFIDNRDVEHLNLNTAEQTNLTKLSLSKIVNNLKKKLQEQESKNQNLSLKLDQALKQKEIYKQRFDELKSQQKVATAPKNKTYQGVGSKLTSHEQQNSSSSSLQLKQTSGMSFKDRQKQKAEQQKAPAKPVESLADRRKNRKSLFDQDTELDSELDKIKESMMERERGASLEQITEDVEIELENELTTINEVEEESPMKKVKVEEFEFEKGPNLEPNQNYSNFLSDQRQDEGNSAALKEEWLQEEFIDMDNQSKLIGFFFLPTRMMAIFENFQVQEIDLATKEVVRDYNLQEIEGFEISSEAEEDKVVDFVLEKDVQLLGVASVDSVHIFEYSEEELTLVAKVEKASVVRVIFVEYILVMAQDEGSQMNLMCYDLESESVTASLKIDKPENLILQTGNQCIYFVANSKIGKIQVPEMQQAFLVETGSKIIDMTISGQTQIITTSQDRSIRFFDTVLGQNLKVDMEEMDCDFITAQGIHLLTRMGDGNELTMLVWRLKATGGVEENPVDEVEIDKTLASKAKNFQMKSGVAVNNENDLGQDTDQLVMMYGLEKQVKFMVLSQKHSKF